MKVTFFRKLWGPSGFVMMRLDVSMDARLITAGTKFGLGSGDDRIVVMASSVEIDVASGWVDVECRDYHGDPGDEGELERAIKEHEAVGFRRVED